MSREQNIPFVLWVCTALLTHLSGSLGADQASRVAREVSQVRLFAGHVKGEVARTEPIEVSLLTAAESQSPEAKPDQEPEKKPPEPKPPEPKPTATPPTPEPEKTKQDKAPEPKPIAILPSQSAAAALPPPPEIKKDPRIAVKQHVKDKSQADNPNARFVGDEANHVEEESVARNTSHDTDDPNPSFGAQHAGPSKDPGNSDSNRVGQADDHPGDPNHAPGESAKNGNEPLPAATPGPPPTALPTASPEHTPRSHVPLPPAQPQPAAAQPPAAPNMPGSEAVTSGQGGYSLDPRRKTPASPASSSTASLRPTAPNPSAFARGAGPNERGVQLNLAQKDVVAAVGADQLSRERANDGERRRSAKRGSWSSSTFERWRPAIENYVSSVRPGNQTALNTARVPFATYLVAIHNRLHPIFADGFLDSLDSLPAGHPMNDYKIVTALEIVLDRDQGRLVKMGVVKTSGITAFDVAALDSVYRSQPFGKPPDAIVSADGNVYLHWEFHRNPIYACSTMNARPFMLNRPPGIDQPKPPSSPPSPPGDPREKGVPPAPAPPGGPDRSRFGNRGQMLPQRARG